MGRGLIVEVQRAMHAHRLRLHALGNAVVPDQAEAAFVELFGRFA